MLAGALRRATRRFRGGGVSVPLGALVVAGLLAPALAAAVWTAPLNLSPAAQDASAPQVAVDADGDAVFVWQASDGTNTRIQTRARSAGGALSPVKTISPAGEDAAAPQVAVDADGDAVFTWTRIGRIQTRARSAAGAVSTVQTLSPAVVGPLGAFQPEVAVDADGDAVFTWTSFDGANFRVQARARSAAGALSPLRTLSGAGQSAFGLTGPQVAVDTNGDAVFTWERSDGTNGRVQARARSAAGALSPVQTLSPAGEEGSSPQVAVDADGDAVFTWVRGQGGPGAHRGEDPTFPIRTRARTAAGALSAVQNLTLPGQNGSRPDVAVDADGDAVFTWVQFGGQSDGALLARARSAAGGLSAQQTLSASGNLSAVPQVAVDANGDAVFAWERKDGSLISRAQARARSAAGTLSPVQTLSTGGQNALGAQVAVDATGDATVTWQRSDGTRQRVQASVGP